MAEKNSIQSFSEAHEIGKEFYKMQQEIDSEGVDVGYGMKTVSTPWDNIDKVDYFSQTYDGLDNQYYIRFQYFLWFLQETIIPNVDFDLAIKLIKIDFWDVDTNLIYIVPGTLSSNPNVCMTKRGYYNVDWVDYLTIPAAETFQLEFPGTTSGALYGKIMNIYFNMFWILQQIDALKDSETGKISLYGLLDALCKGYNQATGNFNRLEPTVDTETNTIKIIDDVALPDRDLILKTYDLVPSSETALFDTYGYYYALSGSVYGEGVPHASFIRDLSFNTSVTPNLATMITVGATNQGYVKGEDATALSRMNRGLTDRFKKQITNADETSPTSSASLPPLEVQYAGAITAYNNYIKNIGCDTSEKIPTYDEDAVSDFQSLQTQLIEYYQARATIEGSTVDKNAASPNAGFLPFDLSLTMDGLSGMKVYQTFNIDSEFLPTNYPGTLLFLIKGITNNIENNQWTTTIESMCVAKNPFAASGSSNPVDEASRTSNRGYTSPTRKGSGVYTPSNLNAVKGNASLKQVLINAGYKEGTGKYQFAYSIGTKEGWNSRANGGIGTRSYRNNNPGNLNYDNSLKSIDPGVTLENNPYGDSRFAHFTTAELGAKALVETKIQRWANGKMPITKGNQTSIVQQKGGNKYQQGSKPTIAQFFYTYAPPTDGNDTEKYINDVIKDLKSTKPSINRNTLVENAIV